MNLKQICLHIMLVMLLGAPISLLAQDIHYSQIERSPLNYNPALAGDFNATYRLVLNNKQQWNSFTNGYKTFSGSIDTRRHIAKKPIHIGTGILFNSDVAGDGNLGLMNIQIPLAIHYELAHMNTTISLGFMAGLNQYKVDLNKLTFGTDYNGHIFNPTQTASDPFGNNQLSFLDLSTGFNLLYGETNQTSAQLGISYFHLNQPDVSFSGDRFNKLPGKVIIHALFTWPVSSGAYVLPHLFYFNQGPYQEILAGAYYRIHPNNMQFHMLRAGFFYRGNDAVILKFGFDYLDYSIGLSYDFNISTLTKASNGMGGFEFSLIYLINTHKKITKDRNYCPSFL